MAKVLFGAAIADMRGRVGGLVASHNKAGSICRRWSHGKTFGTNAQLDIRGNLHALSKRWSQNLNDTQRAAWGVLGHNNERTPPWGPPYRLTGLQIYICCNQAIKAIGGQNYDDPPPSLTVGSPLGCSLTWHPATPALVVAPNTNPGAHDIPTIWATPQTNAGKLVVAHMLKTLTYEPATPPYIWDITQEYTDKHGDPISGRRVTVALFYTDDRTGWQSAEFAATLVFD